MFLYRGPYIGTYPLLEMEKDKEGKETGKEIILPYLFYVQPKFCIGSIDLGSLEEQSIKSDYRQGGLFLTTEKLDADLYDLICEGNPFEVMSGGKITDILKQYGVDPEGDTVGQQILSILKLGDPKGFDTVKPIMPTLNGKLELFLGEFKSSESFRYGKDSYTGVVNAIVADDLRRVINEDDDTERAKRVLDYWTKTLKVDDFKNLVPEDLKNELNEVKPHNTTYDDNFNGHGFNVPLNTFGWTDIIGSMATDGGSFSGNSAYLSSGVCQEKYSSAMDGANQTVWSSHLMLWYQNESLGPAARMASDGSTYYMAYSTLGSAALAIHKWIGGSHTLLANTTGANRQVPKCDADGSTIKSSYYNGSGWTLVDSVTDTSITSGSYAGVFAYAGNPGYNLYWDNWHAEDLSSGFTVSPSEITSEESVNSHSLSSFINPSSLSSVESVNTPLLKSYVIAYEIQTLEHVSFPGSDGGTSQLGIECSSLGSMLLGTGNECDEEGGDDGPIVQEDTSTASISPSSINGAEDFGVVLLVATINTSSISSLESVNSVTLLPGQVSISPSSIGSLESVGSHFINLVITAQSIASTEEFGNTVICIFLLPDSTDTEEAVNEASLTSTNSLFPSAIDSLEYVDTPVSNLSYTVTTSEIVSAESVTVPVISGSGSISPVSVDGSELVNSASLIASINPASLSSQESVSIVLLVVSINTQSINSVELVSQVTLTLTNLILPTDIASGNFVSIPEVELSDLIIYAGSVNSLEAFGLTIIILDRVIEFIPGAVNIIHSIESVMYIEHSVNSVVRLRHSVR